MDPLMTTVEVAELLHVSPGTVENWRYKNMGPPFVRLNGRFVRYRRTDVVAFLDGLTE